MQTASLTQTFKEYTYSVLSQAENIQEITNALDNNNLQALRSALSDYLDTIIPPITLIITEDDRQVHNIKVCHYNNVYGIYNQIMALLEDGEKVFMIKDREVTSG